MSDSENARLVKRFVATTSVVVVLVMIAIFMGFTLRMDGLLRGQVRSIMETRLDQIDRMHRWLCANSQRIVPDGGTAGQTVNPHALLAEIVRYDHPTKGVECEFVPAVSAQAGGSGGDAFEQAGLRSLMSGKRQFQGIEDRRGGKTYRIMRPTVVEQSCLRCHSQEGYRVGQIAGALSVRSSMTAMNARIRASHWATAAVALVVLLGILGMLWIMAWRLRRVLSAVEANLMALASIDPLTGVLNRRALFQELDNELARSRRHSYPLSCIMLDLDHFKRLNDEFGHPTGDRILREVARMVQSACRQYDAVGRYGGEEFLILAPATHTQGAVTLAERIRIGLEATPIPHNGTAVRVTASFGVASTHHDMVERVDEFVSRADRALYRAKDQGRNRVGVLD